MYTEDGKASTELEGSGYHGRILRTERRVLSLRVGDIMDVY